MNNKKLFGAVLFGALMMGGQAAMADEPVSRLEAYVVTTNDEGAEQYQPASKAAPGDVIEYRLSYLNEGDKAIRDLAVQGPIPTNTNYIGNTSSTTVASDFQVSIDGGDNWEAEPVTRTRTLPDGTVETYVIPPEDYSHVRWLPKQRLSAGETQVYTYRVMVENQ